MPARLLRWPMLALLTLGPATAPGADWVTSGSITLRFGVEADWTNSTRVDLRHADVSIYYCGGLGASFLRADAPPALTNLPVAAAHLHANTNTREVLASVPPSYAFLGVTNQQRFWNLEQNYFANQLWLGLRGEGDLDRLALWNPGGAYPSDGRYFRVELSALRGPPGGHFSLFQWGSPPTVYLATADGVGTGDVFHIAAGGHDHFNWSFTAPGLYEVDLRLATFITAFTQAAPTVVAWAPTGGQAVVTWTCAPCLRFWLEQAGAGSDTAVWAAVSTTTSPAFAATHLSATVQVEQVEGVRLLRVRGAP
jgi:surface-anchored protein